MNRQLVMLIALSTLVYAVMMGSRVAVTIAAVKITDSNAVVGVLVSMYSMMPMFFGLWMGRLIDRFGILRPIAGAAAVSLVGTLLPFMYPSVWTLGLASAANGLSFIITAMSLTNAGAQIGKVEDRTRNLSLIYLGNSAGMAIGPLVAGFGIDHFSYRGTFAMLALLPALSLALLGAWRHLMPGGRGTGKPPSGHPLDFLRNPQLRTLIMAHLMISVCMEAFYFGVPLHGTRAGLSASMIGTIISAAFVANFVSRSFVAMLIRQVGEATLVSAVFVIAGVSVASFAHFTLPAALMVTAAGVGICHGMAIPIITSIAFTASPPGRQGEISGVRTMMLNGSIAIMQMALGSLSTLVGIAPVMWAMGALGIGAARLVRKGVSAKRGDA